MGICESFRTDFINWGASRTYYDNYLRSVNDYLVNYFQDKSLPYKNDYLYYVAYFQVTGRNIYSVAIVNEVIRTCEERRNNAQITKEKKSIQNELSALRCLVKYLRSRSSLGDRCEIPNDNVVAKKIISHFNKPVLPKIDGMETLLNVLGEDGFIKAVIENTYFFSPKSVSARFDEMANVISAGDKLPARKSTQDSFYEYEDSQRLFVDSGFRCPIVLDKDGNAEVRKIINNETGYTISQGKGSIFQNYCISHIWGKAYDSRYFTSLWNLAIIPAWANSLMDKIADEESDEVEHLAARLKSIVEALCWKLYDMENLEWSGLRMEMPKITDVDCLTPQTFTLQILDGDIRIICKKVRIDKRLVIQLRENGKG